MCVKGHHPTVPRHSKSRILFTHACNTFKPIHSPAFTQLCTIHDVSVSRSMTCSIEPGKDQCDDAEGFTWLVTFLSLQYPGDQHTRDTSWMQPVDKHRLSINGEHLLSCDDAALTTCHRNKETTVATASTQETQSFVCNTASEFYLTFMNLVSDGIQAGIPLQGDGNDGTSLEEILNNMESVNAGAKAFEAGIGQPARHQFQVSVSSDATGEEAWMTVNNKNVTKLLCNGETVSITFDTLNGDLPQMYYSATSSYLDEEVKGVTQPVVGRLPVRTLSSNFASTRAKPLFTPLSPRPAACPYLSTRS